MAVWLDTSEIPTTQRLLAYILQDALRGERVQFLCDPSSGPAVVQRLRVALSRSRDANRARGRKIREFTLKHELYPYTHDGKRKDCVVMWIERYDRHEYREILDDLVEREA